MTTAVSICSNALLMLGDKPINSFDENTDRCRLAKNLYPNIRDYILRSHPWNCAIKRVALSPDATAPDFDYAYRFLKPGDWLRTLSVGEQGCAPEYLMEGDYILCDSNVLRLRYIFRQDEAKWDAMLVHCAQMVMREVFAYPITASTSLEALINQVLDPILKRARAVDGQEDPPQTFGNESMFESGF